MVKDSKGKFSWARKKVVTEGEENRRKSLLPWNNLKGSSNKGRSKSTERASSSSSLRKGKDDRNRMSTEIPPSNSNTNQNGEDSCTLTRVILPDKSTTVIQPRPGDTIRAMISRLLDKRGLRFTSFDVFVNDQLKPLDLSEDGQILHSTEVRVEPRVLFRLELPSKKSIGVKAKPAKVIRDVLEPILLQYGWHLEDMIVKRDFDGHDVNLEETVSAIDNSRLVVIDSTKMNEESRILEDILRRKRVTSDTEDIRSNSSRGSSLSRERVRNNKKTN